MARVIVAGEDGEKAFIDYSLVDGRVRVFELMGTTLYDEHVGLSVDGWKEKLTGLVVEQKWNIDGDGLGLHAFVRRMIEDGLLTEDVP